MFGVLARLTGTSGRLAATPTSRTLQTTGFRAHVFSAGKAWRPVKGIPGLANMPSQATGAAWISESRMARLWASAAARQTA